VHWLEVIYETMEAGARLNTVPGQFGEWFDGGSLTNRGMYLSPWTGAKYLWGVAETVCGLDGYRTSGRPHLSPLIPSGWDWTAAVRVHWGGRRCTYVIDAKNHAVYGDMTDASADEPYAVYYSGKDVTDEVTTSPVDIGAVAFEDANGAVRLFLCNQNDHARNVSVEFRGRTHRQAVASGTLADIALIGKHQHLPATPALPDAPAALAPA
jgi:hypothetical protein